jgi:hypothetical protein
MNGQTEGLLKEAVVTLLGYCLGVRFEALSKTVEIKVHIQYSGQKSIEDCIK